MVATGVLLLGVTALGVGQDAEAHTGGDRIHGRVTTVDGAVVEGYLRWDRNEGSWADLLDGYRRLPEENRLEAERLGAGDRERSVELFGVRVSWEEEADWPETAESGVRFGHIRRLRVLGEDEALVELKSGERVELSGGSTDLGSGLRGLEVDDGAGGRVELSWEDLQAVELGAPPPGRAPSAGRLHGTLEDRHGRRYTGYVAWNLDEILTSDVLDGEEEGVAREIPFGDVVTIRREGRRASRVSLRDGRELILRGSDDVGDGNRGIQVSDPALGQIQVGWSRFEALRLHPPARIAAFDDFDGGRRLRGTVRTEDGTEHTGRIRWDNDEAWSWEILDGRFRGVVYDIEFGNVARVEKRSARSAEVTLRDGRTFELEDSNDLNRDNKGIFVTSDEGVTVMVDWAAFREVVFEGPPEAGR